jgi:hypothetical protein
MPYREVDMVQRERAEEALGQTADFDNWRRIGHEARSFAKRPVSRCVRRGESRRIRSLSRAGEAAGVPAARTQQALFVPFQIFT